MKMSYLCLISNNNGVSISADSRLTARKAHFDHAMKVFGSDDLIFGIAGSYRKAGETIAKVVRNIMLDESASPEVRISSAVSYLRFQTKAFDTSCSLLIAAKGESGKIVCSIDIKSGYDKRRDYSNNTLVAIQNGLNSDKLTDLKEYLPSKETGLEEICDLSKKRVSESIAYDYKMHNLLGYYVATVGGEVNTVSLKW